VVHRVQWLGGRAHSTPTTITTPARTSLSGKIKLFSTPSSFYSKNVSRIINVWVYDPKAPAADKSLRFLYWINVLGSCGNEWYYYQFWLSDRETREEMRKIWLEPQRGRWWKKTSQCRLTRVLALGSLLKRTFGEEWEAPIPTLDTPVRSWQYVSD
jgi:hypothetical protein